MEVIVQVVILIIAVLSALMGYGTEDDSRSTICAVMSLFLFSLLMIWVSGVGGLV